MLLISDQPETAFEIATSSFRLSLLHFCLITRKYNEKTTLLLMKFQLFSVRFVKKQRLPARIRENRKCSPTSNDLNVLLEEMKKSQSVVQGSQDFHKKIPLRKIEEFSVCCFEDLFPSFVLYEVFECFMKGKTFAIERFSFITEASAASLTFHLSDLPDHKIIIIQFV